MRKIINWIIDKWLAGFITASIFFILKLYIELPAETKSNFFRFEWLKELMSTQLSLFTVLIIISIIILITRIDKSILKAKFNSKNNDSDFPNPPKNHYEHYKSDIFGINGSKWVWKYEWQPYKQHFIITDLRPLCPKCKTPMEIDTSSILFSNQADCYKCRLDGKQSTFTIRENIGDVEKEIIRRIKNNEVPVT